MSAVVCASAWSTSRRLKPAPLCAIARWKSPRAAGTVSRHPTLWPPADSPKIVTLAGSPPKAAMWSRTQPQRGDLVEQRDVARAREPLVEMVEVREAERAEPVVDRDHDHVAATRQLGGVEERARPDVERAAVDPDHHRMVRGDRRVRAERSAGVNTLSERQSSPNGMSSMRRNGVASFDCGARGPHCVASRTPVHGSTGCGGRNRRSPRGGAANGMPRNCATPSAAKPSQLAVVERDPHVRGRFGGRTT